MIVFTIAYGRPYILKFFNQCLPSLLTPNNLPLVADQNLELLFFTLRPDEALVREQIAKLDLSRIFGDRITVFTLDILPNLSRTIVKNCLCKAADICIKKDRSFFFAVPDLIYSDGLISTCLPIHQLTGKAVTIFNGRVTPDGHRLEFSPEEISEALLRQHGIRNFFFRNMSDVWLASSTDNVDVTPGDDIGRLLYRRNGIAYIWYGAPVIALGRFEPEDMLFFASADGLGVWDWTWQNYLLHTYRLFVQTNLDLCMSVESVSAHQHMSIQEDGSPATLYEGFEKLAHKYAPEKNSRKKYKFASQYGHFCFMATLPEAGS